MNRSRNWEKDSEYGFFAENEVAGFFSKRGWNVEFAEEYAAFTPGEYYGPRILILPPGNYCSIEHAEVSYVSFRAPDLRVNKNGKEKYIEIKRREHFSRFNGEDVVYIDRDQFDDYCSLSDYGYTVFLIVYVDDCAKDHVYSASIEKLYKNIQHKTKDYVAFNKRTFNELKV